MEIRLIRLSGRRFGIALAALALLPLVFSVQAWGDAPQVTVQTVPGEVLIPPQGEARVLVILRNGSGERLKDLKLSWLTQAGVEVSAEPADAGGLEPYGEIGRALRLSRVPDGPSRGEVHLRLDYVWLRPEGDARRVAVGSLKVAPREPEAVAQVASAEVKTAMKSLVERRPGLVYLVINNTSNVPVDIVSAESRAPAFIAVEPGKITQRRTLPPRDTLVLPFDVKTAGAIRPGKHLLLFQVGLEWESGGRKASGTLVATHETDVGILGESEILTLLGVPTFLVLPGFLMLVTLGLLWQHVPPRTEGDRKPYPFAKVSPEFWVVAISVSIAAAILDPWITGFFGQRRNYLDGYELIDVVRVWAGSIFAGILVFVAWRAVTAGISRWRQSRAFQTGDSALTVLRKLDKQGLGLRFPGIRVKLDKGETTLFQLRRAGNRIWVAPGIALAGLDAVGGDLAKKIRDELRENGDPGRLLALLEGVPEVGLDWSPNNAGRDVPFLIDESAQVGELQDETNLIHDAADDL